MVPEPPVWGKGLFPFRQIIRTDEAFTDIRPVVINGTTGIQEKFAAVFNDQLVAAGQSKV